MRDDLSEIYFEKNDGQFADDIRFLAHTPLYSISLREAGASLDLHSYDRSSNENSRQIAVTLKKAQTATAIFGEEHLDSRSHYFHSDQKQRWLTNVSHFASVRYQQVYPQIDLKYYSRRQQLEYDFIVHPGGNPDDIEIAFSGIDDLVLDDLGNAVLHIGDQTLLQHRPEIYQMIEGVKIPVSGRYELVKPHTDTPANASLKIQLSHYDSRHALIIDPVLSYSTLMGSAGKDAGNDIALDTAGNIYVLSQSEQAGYNAQIQHGPAACEQSQCASRVMVSKFRANGAGLDWVANISGSNADQGRSIAVAEDGKVYVGGWTSSADFPLQAAFDTDLTGQSDAFILILDNDGDTIRFSSLLGGDRAEIINDLVLDGQGDILITGRTSSEDFGVIADFDPQRALQQTDAFVAKINTATYDLDFASYFGGAHYDSGNVVKVDQDDNIYIIGTTGSEDFPLKNPLQAELNGSNDLFITKFNADSSETLFSTFLGGSGLELGKAAAISSSGDLYILGQTTSLDIAGAVNTAFGEDYDWDGVLARIAEDGSHISHLQYVGGSNRDYFSALAIDAEDNILLAGHSLSTDFPSINSTQSHLYGDSDAVLMKLKAESHEIDYATFLGGSGSESSVSLATDAIGSAYLTGLSHSSDFPLQQPLQDNLVDADSFGDTFISIITDLLNTTIPHAQWRVIALPYRPPVGATIADLFADDINASYKSQWYMYRYNTVSGYYSLLDLDDRLEHGVAYWLMQRSGEQVTLDMPATSSPVAPAQVSGCQSAAGCYSATLETTSNTRQYHFIGNPFAKVFRWEDLRLVTDGGLCAAPLGCNLTQAQSANLLIRDGWTYQGTSTSRLSIGSSVEPWQGFWVRTLTSAHGLNPRLLIPY